MSYETSIQKDLPYSFYNVDALAGARIVAPLVIGTGNAAAVKNSTNTTFTFPGFVSSRKNQPFGLELWFRPLSSENTRILGHAEGDGIYYDGTIKFIIKFATAADAVVQYAPEGVETFHVLATYNLNGIRLYVNGLLRDSYEFTAVQQTDSFVTFTSETTLTSGNSVSGNSEVIIDAVALYTHNVSATLASRHYADGSNVSNIYETIGLLGGGLIELNDQAIQHIALKEWSEYGWDDGLHTNTNSILGYLTSNNGTTGVWQGSAILPDEITSSTIEWLSTGGITVEVSLSGVWTAVKNGYPVSGITSSTRYIDIRVTFLNQNSTMSYLRISSQVGGSIKSVRHPRSLTISGGLSDKLFYPINNPEHAGIKGSSYPLVISDGENVPLVAIEFWIKFDSVPTSEVYLLDSTATNRTYLRVDSTNFNASSGVTMNWNGVLGFPNTSSIRAGEWNHVIVRLSADRSANTFRFGSIYAGGQAVSAQFGLIALYETQPDATLLYGSYFKKNSIRIDETINTNLTETSNPFDIYTYDWTIVTAGG